MSNALFDCSQILEKYETKSVEIESLPQNTASSSITFRSMCARVSKVTFESKQVVIYYSEAAK